MGRWNDPGGPKHQHRTGGLTLGMSSQPAPSPPHLLQEEVLTSSLNMENTSLNYMNLSMLSILYII